MKSSRFSADIWWLHLEHDKNSGGMACALVLALLNAITGGIRLMRLRHYYTRARTPAPTHTCWLSPWSSWQVISARFFLDRMPSCRQPGKRSPDPAVSSPTDRLLSFPVRGFHEWRRSGG